MNAFQNCYDTSDSIPLYLPQQLYLKPIARLNISLQLPSRMLGKSISNWEAMEKLRLMIKPEKFVSLKVTKSNLEFIRFEAELDNKIILERAISKLDNKMIKLKEFPELMKIRAGETKLKFPSRHEWDSFFRDAKDMNEMKSGERPDTLYLSNLPIKWFVPYHLSDEEDAKPAEKIFFHVFEKFGKIRNIDVPICDSYRNKMKAEVSGMRMYDFNEPHYFEGYVQYKDYIGFTKAMDALRGMKLLHKTDNESHTVNINVEFDKSKHLSDASIRRREIVRDRLVKKEIEKEDKQKRQEEEESCKIQAERQHEIDEKLAKEQRRLAREERRKAKLLAKLKVKSSEDINEKIVKEEKKLLKAQRKLEAIRLIEELFKRIKIKKEKTKQESMRNSEGNELHRLKSSSEIEVRQQKEKLNQVIQGRTVLKSLLTDSSFLKHHDGSSSSDSSTNNKKRIDLQSRDSVVQGNRAAELNSIPQGDWYGYPPSNGVFPYQVPPVCAHPMNYYHYQHQNRGRGRGIFPGSSRGNYYSRGGRGRRYRGHNSNIYPPEIQAQYYRYFEKFLHKYDDHDHSRSRTRSLHSRSRSRQRSSSHSRRRSSSHSRRRSSSFSRQRSYSRTRYRSVSRSIKKSHSRSSSSVKHSHSKSRSRSKSKRSRRYTRSKSRSRSYTRSKRKSYSRKRSTSPKRTTSKKGSHSRSRSSRKSKEKLKSRSPSYRSIDSSKFISPSRLRMPRSKSWSVPN